MSRLGELQQAFADGVMEGMPHRLTAKIAPAKSALRSVALYRRVIRYNYTQVLKITFPVLLRILGPRYFETLARGYIQTYPSTSGDLFPFGRHFPVFLGAIQAKPWLGELARLEWTCHEIYQAADAPPISQEHLKAVAAVDPAHVTVFLHPAVRVLRFSIPVHRVWLALQPDAPEGIDMHLPLPKEENGVMVVRGDEKVQVVPLPVLDTLLLEAMSRKVDLVSVERMGLESNSEFKFSRFLANLLDQHVIAGFLIKDSQ